MASDNEASCESDPNFAVICAFMEKFGATCGIASIDFLELQEMLENTQEVPQDLIDLHIKLLRKSRKTVSNERWEKAIIKFCHSFCVQDAWEIERFGYKKARLSSKLRVLKELLEMQFDYNARFKSEINKMSAEELRSQPLGKDKQGHAYWFQNDNNCQIRVYKEDPDEETWTLVAKDRDGLIALIDELSNGDADSKAIAESVLNEEDSNSLVEKPIIDTGQVDSSSSDSIKKSLDESENSNEKDISPPEESEEEDGKRTRESDGEDRREIKKAKMDDGTVEEPIMLVTGEGNGVDNECENPIIGEEIEEDPVYIYGNGNGADCQTGNEDETKKTDETTSDSAASGSENCVSISVKDDSKNCEVPTSPSVKTPFKLGTIIDTKTDNKFFNTGKSPTKKSSRWDVETIIAKEPTPPPPKKSMFFFGPGCLQFKPPPVSCSSATVAFGQKVPQAAEDDKSVGVSSRAEEMNDVGYRIDASSECVQSSEVAGPINDEKVEGTLLFDQQTPLGSKIENKLEDIDDKGEETKADEQPSDQEKEMSKDNKEVNKEAEIMNNIKLDEKVEPEMKNVEERSEIANQEELKKVVESTDQPEQVVKAEKTEVQDEDLKLKIEKCTRSTENEETDVVLSKLEEPVEITKHEEKEDAVPELKDSVEEPTDNSKSEGHKVLQEIRENAEEQEAEVSIRSPNNTKKEIKEQILVEPAEEGVKIPDEEKEVTEEIKEPVEEVKEESLLEPVETVKEASLEPAENVEEKFEKTHLELTEKVEAASLELTEKIDEACLELTEKVEEEALLESAETVEESQLELTGKIDDASLKLREKVKETHLELTEKNEEDALIVPTQKMEAAPSELTEKVEEASSQLTEKIEEASLELSEKIKEEASLELTDKESLMKPTKEVEATPLELTEKIEVSSELIEKVEDEVLLELTEKEEVSSVHSEKVEEKSSLELRETVKKKEEESELSSKLTNCVEEKIETEIIKEDGMDKTLTKDKNENISSKESEQSLKDANIELKREPELLSALEKEIVPKEDVCMLKIKVGVKIPEVTATLIECQEETDLPNVEEIKPTDLTKYSCAESKSEEIKEPVPVIEEECVKKHSYLLGEETESKINTPQAPQVEKLENKEPPILQPCDTQEKSSSIKEETKDNQQTNCLPASIEETVICGEQNETVKEAEEESPPVLEEELKKEEDQAPINNKRGRKNNISDQPKMITRRSTRSSKNEEPKVVEESDIKEEKKPEDLVPPRRGRSRGMTKVEKEEVSEMDSSKKIKLSDEVREDETKSRMNKVKEEEVKSEPSPEVMTVIESGNSSDVADLPDKDPLAVFEEEKTEEKPAPMSLTNFSLDFTESPTPPLTRSGLRKRSRESPNAEEVEETAGKRLKKAKRNIDVKLRKSIEEQKKQELISSDDDKQQPSSDEVKNAKKKGNKQKKEAKNDAVEVSSDAETPKETEPAQKKSKTVNKNKRLLSNLGINPDQVDFAAEAPVGVRQSRRIAQLKIKEEAERRKLEEEMAQELQEKKKKKSKKSEDKEYKVKKSKSDPVDDDDDAQEEDSTDSKKRKKKKKKKHKRLFDELNPWRSSSDSSTTDDEEEEEDEIAEEEDEVLQYVSDHEFSPESDLEADGEAQPLKRARTARKESDVEEVDDCPCQKCGKSDHPEWILLCDRCDNGWHCSCLRPPLLVIPEGDWFCPPCQHGTLLRKLQEKLKDYDKKIHKKEIEDRRKERLAYVGISLNNVLPAKETTEKWRWGNKEDDDDEEEDEDDARDEDAEVGDEEDEEESEESESGTASESGSDSDEPIYQLRQRRQAHSYRFNDYDELINSAIQEEMDAVKGAGNQGRGKDIATIVNAEKEEEKKKETENEAPPEKESLPPEVKESLPPVVPVDDRDKEAKPLYSDDEPVVGMKKRIVGRKKHRKLNSLDISSADDDEDSDEDFKGTSDESDEDFDEDLGSEDSEDLDTGRNRRRNAETVRRSTRARTSRYDADFIDDGDSEDEDEAPRRKKKRSIWDESESEESDRSWGRRKRKPPTNRKKHTSLTATTPSKKKKSKKKKKNDDSDAEVYRKKKPKIKFGMDGEEEGPGRRTRGKKINYVDALGSDSDEDRVKRPPPRIESEEEYVAEDDEEDEKVTDEEESATEENSVIKSTAAPKIQSYADARFTQLLPEGIPTPKDLYVNNQVVRDQEDGEDEPNPIDQINRNVEMMDENEMEKMMEEEEYANKQLQMVAMQLEKEKRRKEREAKKLEGGTGVIQMDAKKGGVVAKPPMKDSFQFRGPMQEPIVGNVDSLIVNAENNDELSEPPGVSLPMFAELAGENLEDSAKKRRARSKKSLEEAVANLGTVRQQQESGFLAAMATTTTTTNNNKNLLPTDLSSTPQQDSNIEIAAPPQPFSQSQPTPSVITRMLQNKPGQPGYPVGTIRPKQFASLSERDDEVPTSAPPAHHGQYMQGAPMRPQLANPYRQLPPAMNHYPRVGAAPPPPSHQIRNPVVQQSLPPHLYHSHRPLDPSPSGGGAISIADHHNSPGRVVSPASGSPGSKTETPPPPYSRPPPVVGRFPMINTTSAAPRHIPMVAPQHLAPRPNLSPYHPSMPPSYHYGQFGGQPIAGAEDAMPPTVYQNSPYSEQFTNEGQVNPSENSNSKSFDDESGGEFGGLVSYFSSQREDDLES